MISLTPSLVQSGLTFLQYYFSEQCYILTLFTTVENSHYVNIYKISNTFKNYTIRYKMPKSRACFLVLLLISPMNSENLVAFYFVQEVVNYETLKVEYLK